MNSIQKRLLVECLIMAAQYKMRSEGNSILDVLPFLVADENDRALCEALYYILLKDEAAFFSVRELLSLEMNKKLDFFILN
ncbi:hypothetical protein DMZ75_21810 [Salmonella enterica subsp. diarizonae]|nr:hypothetical protein [Salmonella enterica subsp. diarizonae]